MAVDRFDGFLRLEPSSRMTTKVLGETLDSKKKSSEDDDVTGIEIASFSFGNSKSKLKDDDDDDDDEDGEKKKKHKKHKRKRKKGKKIEDDYRFKISKQVESASPTLFQAYYSNSFKRGRAKYNDFSTAVVMIRKPGASGDRPKTYLTFTFKEVHVVGYELETEGAEPPKETVEFSFLECEMKYRQQFKDGSLAEPKVVKCDFKKHEPSST